MINIVYFAKYREHLGCSREHYDLPEAGNLDSLREAIVRRHGEPARLIVSDARCVVAINQQVIAGNPALHDGDEIAFFPPVTGG